MLAGIGGTSNGIYAVLASTSLLVNSTNWPPITTNNFDGNGNFIAKETALDERGNVVKGRGDQPNEHDILTGSRADGTASAGAPV